MTHSGYPAMQAVVRSTSHNHTQVLDRRDHSGLMLAARITLAHFLLRGCHPALGKRVVGDGGGGPMVAVFLPALNCLPTAPTLSLKFQNFLHS